MGDLFGALGPLSTFNAEDRLSAPIHVELRLSAYFLDFGFNIGGYAPVSVVHVRPGGLADVLWGYAIFQSF